MLRNDHGCREGRACCSRGEWPCPWTGMRSKRLLESDSTVPQACVLGFTLQGLKFISNYSASHGYWDCLISLPHGVRRQMIFNLIGCNYTLYHVCVDRCLSRLVNPTRTWKLKFESKDLLFVAFQQKKPRAFKSFTCLAKGLWYTLRPVSLAEY